MIRAVALSSLLLGSILLPFLGASSAMADSATLLGVFTNWRAFQTGTGDSMTCYAMSAPRAMQPKAAKRGDIFLMVSDWPARKVKGEPQILPGYQYKLTTPVTLGIGPDKFTFFSRNNGTDGTAWLQNLKDSQNLMEALTHGVSAVAIGTSLRGTRTVDTYSLAGFSDAMAKIHSACNM